MWMERRGRGASIDLASKDFSVDEYLKSSIREINPFYYFIASFMVQIALGITRP